MNLPQNFSLSIKKSISQLSNKLGISHWIRFSQQDYTLRLCPVTEHRWLQPADTLRPVEKFFRRYIKAGDTVIDAGANVGVFTMVFGLMVQSSGRVYTIEPHPQAFALILENIRDNGFANIQTFNVALGNASGQTHFSDNLNNSDLNHVLEDNAEGILVPVKRLDDLEIDEDTIALLKVDVEGYEKFVLEGAVGLISRVECLFIEVEEKKCQRFGYSAKDLINLICSFGFNIMRISGNVVSHTPIGFVPKQDEDLVAVRDVNLLLARTGYELNDLPLDVPSLRMKAKR